MSSGIPGSEPRDGDLKVNGLRLHFIDWGGQGEPILIVHATGFLGRIYAPIAEALRPLGHVYSYDQAGHGDSERPALEQVGWDRTADDLEAFILAMGLSGVRAIGHSAGGTVIAAVAGRRADLISCGVLVDPVIVHPASPLEAPADLRERTLKRRRTFDSVAAAYDNFVRKPPYDTWQPEILRAYCEYGTRANPDGSRTLKCPPEIEAQIYATGRDFDGLEFVMRCGAPLLVMFGEGTNSPGIELAAQIADANPRRKVTIVPGTTHFIPMEQPEIVARIAADFFNEQKA